MSLDKCDEQLVSNFRGICSDYRLAFVLYLSKLPVRGIQS